MLTSSGHYPRYLYFTGLLYFCLSGHSLMVNGTVSMTRLSPGLVLVPFLFPLVYATTGTMVEILSAVQTCTCTSSIYLSICPSKE